MNGSLPAAQVPLEHRLREVPESLRLILETDTSLSSWPVGHLCHEAALEIERLRKEVRHAQARG